MPRIRYLKPEFFKDEDLAEFPCEVRLFYAGLWCLADKAGRLEDRPKRLAVEIFPYVKVNAEKFLEMLSAPKKSSGRPFLLRYSIKGERYLQILQWEKHQKPHRTEKESEIPGPDGTCDDNPNYPNRAMRRSIYERDGYACRYCGRSLSEDLRAICLDHVIPVSLGGTNRPDNLATCCKPCNAKKGGRTAEAAGMPNPEGLGSTVRKWNPPAPPTDNGQRTTENGEGEGEAGEDGSVNTVLTGGKQSEPTKLKYLDFVWLTAEEHAKLVAQFGPAGADDRIRELNEGIGSKGYKYKSHYHTILSWDRKHTREASLGAKTAPPSNDPPPAVRGADGLTPLERFRQKEGGR